MTFDHVLFALGIRYVGETTAKEIARHFGNIDAIATATKEQLLEVQDVGEVIADSVFEYFRDSRHLADIDRLKVAGIRFSMEAKAAVSDALAGKTIVISGNFSVSREEMKRLIEANGGKNSSSVSGKHRTFWPEASRGRRRLKRPGSLVSASSARKSSGTCFHRPQAGSPLVSGMSNRICFQECSKDF